MFDAPGNLILTGGSAMTVTGSGMRAFRSAATLVDVLPRVRIQVKDGPRTLLTVARVPGPEAAGGLVMSPCPFRNAVARAHHRMSAHGAQFRFLDLPEGSEPSINIGLPPGDRVLPGFIYRIRATNDHQLFLFMAEMTPDDCRQALAESLDAGSESVDAESVDAGSDPDPDGFRRRVGFHHDAMTDLTVVHTLAPDRDRPAAAGFMSRLLEVCVAAEVLAELRAAPPPRRDPAP